MNKIFATGLILLIGTAAMAQDGAAVELVPPGPHIAFVEESHDFGDIEQGEVVEYTFEFENDGDAPIILSNVLTTCGCTATDWPRDPIAPGEKSSITAKFNSAGKVGRQNKVITIMSNSVNNPERVRIVTNVLPKKTDPNDEN